MKIKIQKATVERPGDVGMDLPPGITARELAPADYHPVDMEEPEAPAKPARERVRKVVGRVKKALHAKAPARKANGRKAAFRAAR